MAHNVNAIYAHYLGPYDGNPVNLNRHTPAEEGRRYVAYMGGADELLRKARMDYEQGDFRWVAQAMHHLVFAQPDHAQGRALLADAMEQMGYQAESSTWRNAYLLGALEARRPFAADRKPRPIVGAAGVLGTLPIDRYLQHLAARVNGPKAQALTVRFDWLMTDEGSCHRVTVRHGALSHLPGSHGAQADAVLHLDRATLVKVVDTGSNFATALDEGLLQASGNVALIRSLFDCLDVFDIGFNIVEP